MRNKVLAVLLRCLAPIVIVALIVICAFFEVDNGTLTNQVTFNSGNNTYEDGWCTQSFDINPDVQMMESEFSFTGTLTKGTAKVVLYDADGNQLQSWNYNAGETVDGSYKFKASDYGDGKYYHYVCTFTQNAEGSLTLSSKNYAYLYKKLLG